MDRFLNSTSLIGKEILIGREEIENTIAKLVDIEARRNGNIKIVFSYGAEKDIGIYILKHFYPTEDMYQEGVDTILYHGERKPQC